MKDEHMSVDGPDVRNYHLLLQYCTICTDFWTGVHKNIYIYQLLCHQPRSACDNKTEVCGSYLFIYESKEMAYSSLVAQVKRGLACHHTFKTNPFLTDTIEDVLLSWRQRTLFCGKVNTKNVFFLLRWVGWLWPMPPRLLRSCACITTRETSSAEGSGVCI